MTEQEAKEWLSRGWALDREINALLRAKRETWERLTNAVGGGGGGVQSTPDPHRFDRYAAFEDLIDEKVDALVDVQKEVVTAISLVEDGVLRTLLLLRYTSFLTWEQIADEMCYSLRRVMQLHPMALAAAAAVIETL